MTHSPVTLTTLKALFTRHFMGDATDGGAWRIVPRGIEGSPALLWFAAHAKNSFREGFWSSSRNGIVCADETEARAILMSLEEEFVIWHAKFAEEETDD